VATNSLNALELVRKHLESPGGSDLLAEMVKTFAEAVMSAEADAACGAAWGESSPDRVNFRNGYLKPRQASSKPSSTSPPTKAAPGPATPSSGTSTTKTKRLQSARLRRDRRPVHSSPWGPCWERLGADRPLRMAELGGRDTPTHAEAAASRIGPMTTWTIPPSRFSVTSTVPPSAGAPGRSSLGLRPMSASLTSWRLQADLVPAC
jgi:hypothetical protein